MNRRLVLGQLFIHVILALAGDNLGGARARVLIIGGLTRVQRYADELVLARPVRRDQVLRRAAGLGRLAARGTLQWHTENRLINTHVLACLMHGSDAVYPTNPTFQPYPWPFNSPVLCTLVLFAPKRPR